MDYDMPVLNGPDATSKIREHLLLKNLDQPIIVGVSGYEDD